MDSGLGGVRETLARAFIPQGVGVETHGDSEVTLTAVTLRPGETSGWHCHPGPVIVTIESGALTYDDALGETHVYVGGQGFVEPGQGHVHSVRNDGPADCRFFMLNVAPAGVPPRTEHDSPHA